MTKADHGNMKCERVSRMVPFCFHTNVVNRSVHWTPQTPKGKSKESKESASFYTRLVGPFRAPPPCPLGAARITNDSSALPDSARVSSYPLSENSFRKPLGCDAACNIGVWLVSDGV